MGTALRVLSDEVKRVQADLTILVQAAQEVCRARYVETEWEPLKYSIAALSQTLQDIGEKAADETGVEVRSDTDA